VKTAQSLNPGRFSAGLAPFTLFRVKNRAEKNQTVN
jgi:hypothetical protein